MNHYGLDSWEEVEHLARLLKARGYVLQPEKLPIWVKCDAPTKAWKETILKFCKQRVIQAAASRNNGQLML